MYGEEACYLLGGLVQACHHKMSKDSGHTDFRSFTKYICENID